ncbi:hypothetical protein C427_3699 [Paraglaciecola psychrophila 170]|uniref:Uncharacterized protein n=1 Tax=Paraglaciecola psychrophila 170 TaxID=1129794 RepID=M4S582_9ALTE|nr:hypothetical protein C427_3699 [Paraglaciecola psychrophila 170]
MFVPQDLKILRLTAFVKKAGAKPLQGVPDQLAHVRSWSKLGIGYINSC